MQFRKNICTILCIILITRSDAQFPKVNSGTIIRYDDFESAYVTSRNVDVWLPAGYSSQKKYPVLYMHDGQMLFDSTTTWNKQEWRVDETITRLVAEGKIKNCIVVGIWNGGITRHPDYFPQKPFESLKQVEKDSIGAQLQRAGRTNLSFHPFSDNYLRFIVKELKPFIDSAYSTKSNKKNTFIAGSSMGGLISMYAVCEYPEVFGGAACLSTHWPGTFNTENNPVPGAILQYMQSHLPNPRNHKIYFDYGDQTLDALYPPLQKKADEVMRQAGYKSNNWITKFFPGEEHSEKAWAKRLALPLIFLLKK
jgi:enterochelin esterase-like enzyme